MVSDFGIDGFRCFSQLRLDGLGRVNLFVGKNAVGKTTVLEALHLYGTGAPPWALRDLLLGRDEYSAPSPKRTGELAFNSLFHGRSLPGTAENGIRIGPLSDDESALRIRPEYIFERPLIENGKIVGRRLVPAESKNATDDAPAELALHVEQFGESWYVRAPLARRNPISRRLFQGSNPTLVAACGVNDDTLAQWWDAVALRDAEQRVADCLGIIVPIERISFVEREQGGRGARMPVARVHGEKNPVSLKSLGDGVFHLFQVALAFEFMGRYYDPQPTLFGERPKRPANNYVLIDEVACGVHYSIHRDLWRAIFRLARLHDVQVFATTHSWDCILGFQAAAAEDVDSQGVLIRLEVVDDRHQAVTFDEQELSVVAREEIEVR